jgi:hypothetical protein
MSSGCKAGNALIIFKHAKIGAKGAKTLITHANSLACFRVKFHFNQGTRGAIEAKSKSSKVVDMPITKEKASTYAYVRTHKRCPLEVILNQHKGIIEGMP